MQDEPRTDAAREVEKLCFRDSTPVALEFVFRDGGRIVRTKALLETFPNLLDHPETTLIDLLKRHEIERHPFFSVNRHSPCEQFEIHPLGQKLTWSPHHVLHASILGRPASLEGNGPRYFSIREANLGGGAGFVYVVEEQTQHWAAERQIEASMVAANAILHAQRPNLKGVTFWTEASDRVSGDFAFAERVLSGGGRRSVLWVAGDCSGHGIDAAVLRMQIMTWLDDGLDQWVKPDRKDLRENEAGSTNPFSTAEDNHPAARILTHLHVKMLQLFDRSKTTAELGSRGFDGAVLYFSRSKKKGEKITVWMASTRFSVYHIKGFYKRKPEITKYPHQRTGGGAPGVSFSGKGVGSREGEKLHITIPEFDVDQNDLFLCLSDGVGDVLAADNGPLPKGVSRGDLHSFVEYLVKNAKGDPEKPRLDTERILKKRQGDKKFKDDVMVTTLDLKALFR